MSGNKAYRRLEKIIQELACELQIRDDQIASMQDDLYRAEENANAANYQARKSAQAAHNAELERQDHERRCESARWEVESATRDLERAKSWGDKYGEERALRRLKYI